MNFPSSYSLFLTVKVFLALATIMANTANLETLEYDYISTFNESLVPKDGADRITSNMYNFSLLQSSEVRIC